MPSPITLTLYDEKDEPKQTFTRSVIPWGVLKKATRLAQSIDEAVPQKRKWALPWMKDDSPKSAEEKQMDAIANFVVELFGNQFTKKELEEGADFAEILAVFRAVMSRANKSMLENPITPRPPS